MTPQGNGLQPIADRYDQGGRLTNYYVDSYHAASYTYSGDRLRLSKTIGSNSPFKYRWDRSSAVPAMPAQDGTNFIYGADGLALEQIDNQAKVRVAGLVVFPAFEAVSKEGAHFLLDLVVFDRRVEQAQAALGASAAALGRRPLRSTSSQVWLVRTRGALCGVPGARWTRCP